MTRYETLPEHDVFLDALPEDVEATIEARDAWVAGLPQSDAGLEFLVSDLQRWQPGQAVRIAFLDGDVDLHRDIEDATRQITDACNITLDFGFDEGTGRYRSWSESDITHAAEIRVSFDQAGFFSLVGTDSIDSQVGAPSGAVGGRLGQRSLNLGGFPVQRPVRWQGTVRHEFMHALAFHHAHQNMRGPCEQAFRWEDDTGYVATRNSQGGFVADFAGRRPGVYTYLSGAPNFWSRAKVDRNLRRMDGPDVIPGPFDRESVMLYRFPQMFYRNTPSRCAPTGDGVSLSAEDRRGLQLLYPDSPSGVSEVVDRREALLQQLEVPGVASEEGLEGLGGNAQSAFAASASRVLRQLMGTKE